MFRKDASELQSFRDKLAAQPGRQFWRSLEELADTDEFQEYLRREFPEGADQWGGASRRDFLKVMGASLALAGLAGCHQQPLENIVPYVDQPEIMIPGKPLYFATAMTMAGIATGLLVENHMGRPTKVEGNPLHPSVPATYWTGDEKIAPGVSDIFAQASILGLYDPDRSQTVMHVGEVSTWDAFLTALRPRLEELKAASGRGIRLLTETVTSPTLAAQIDEFRQQYPEARWHQFEPVNRDQEWLGAELAFGEIVATHYHLDRADVILSLDSDFLISGPDHLRLAWEFAQSRDVRVSPGEPAEMNRLYMLESTPTLTGAQADHRLSLPAQEIEQFTVALARRLGVEADATAAPRLSESLEQWLDVVADDLQNYRRENQAGASLIIAGRFASPLVHALVHAMNHKLGNVGASVTYSQPPEAEPVLQFESLRELAADMRAGEVELLIMLGGNPVYTAPADLQFADALEQVPLRIRLGLDENETSTRCHWHLPETHFLEAWSDARASDGTVSIIQPSIAPLYQGRTSHEVLSALLGDTGGAPFESVKEHWRNEFSSRPETAETEGTSSDFETFWQTALHQGVIPATQFAAVSPTLQSPTNWTGDRPADASATGLAEGRIDVVFRPDPTVWDGRFSNNGWLQELPKPFSKLTWDNAALISPRMAEQFELGNGQVIELSHDDRTVFAPVWVVPGQPDSSITVHFGYGRTRAGRVGDGAGFNAYQLQTSNRPWYLADVNLRATDTRLQLAATQHHHLMEGRHLVQSGTLAEFRENPQHPEFMHEEHELTSLYPEGERLQEGYQWAMTIDLNRCIGCNACTIACQAENNTPVVGKNQVAMGREMHWIRVDSYYEGAPDNPHVVHQPVPCMHCENAPCELVCPVAATVHGDEGLNEMVYNRCVGTRYCSNNCPYKVRRFNFLQYSDLDTPSLELLYNPDVTVRNRGVMEKCTYCVQRISAARIHAEKEDRTIRDGELVTACQAVCPSQAIVFGDLSDPESRVSRETHAPLNYSLLQELNTRPRTTYLAALRNPNPQLVSSETEAVH